MNVGYSGKPLWQKLGVATGAVVVTVDAPSDYAALIGTDVVTVPLETGARFVHAFFTSCDALESWVPDLCSHLDSEGVLWLSWPKRSSKLPTDIDENRLREVVLPFGLVDVKVCAVDDVWSGLKFVVRKDRRADWNR